jgi:hypothetical protein
MDARYFKYDSMPDSSPFNELFKRSDKLSQLKEALHINKTDHFSKLNSTVADSLGFDGTSNSTAVYDDLLDRGL